MTAEPEPATTRGRARAAKNETMVLATRKVIKPSVDEAAEGLRRSTRNRARPARGWLGEKPIYETLANGERYWQEKLPECCSQIWFTFSRVN